MTTPVADFATLGVPSPLVEVLDRQGISEPFPIQCATIPDALEGRDVLGRAPTGSGKTLAFGLPLVAGLGHSESRRPLALILSPTRELAEQIRRELEPLARAMGRKVLAVYGGTSLGPQAKALRHGVDLLVACPGRLQDLIDRGEVSLDKVEHVVVDEADRMADMGFLPAVRALLDLTRPGRQTVLFSATLDRDVKVLIDQYQNDPVTHEVGRSEPDLSTVDHRFIATRKEDKIGLAADLIDDAGPTMVFCRTRHGVDRVARQLKRAGVSSGWIHGGRSQSQRDAALKAFTTGRVTALVATDVAARGIHVDGVACVIHFDPPADDKDYVHRSGRTARAGAGGVVVSMVNSDQRKTISKLQKAVGLPKTELEPTPELQAREVPAWVDARPGRKKTSARSGPKRSKAARPERSTTDRRSRHEADSRTADRAEGQTARGARDERSPERSESRRQRAKRRDRAEGRSRPERTERTDRAEGRSGSQRPERTERTDRAEGGARPEGRERREHRAPGPKRTTSTADQGSRNGKANRRPAGSGGQAAGPGKAKAKPGRKKAPKRSGRSRAKNHKQARRTAS